MKQTLKKLLTSSRIGNIAVDHIRTLYFRLGGGHNQIIIQGVNKSHIYISGRNNSIFIGRGSLLEKGQIRIIGSNNILEIGSDCRIGPDCRFFCFGNNTRITIGEACTFTRKIELNAQENDMTIEIGKDCMLSNRIVIRTSDSHPIYNNRHERLNPPASVFIGNHVWIAPNTKIMKNASIGDGAIIGSDTTVNCRIAPNSLAVGRPCKIVKEEVFWTREPLN